MAFYQNRLNEAILIESHIYKICFYEELMVITRKSLIICLLLKIHGFSDDQKVFSYFANNRDGGYSLEQIPTIYVVNTNKKR